MLIDQPEQMKLHLVWLWPDEGVRLEHHMSNHWQIINVLCSAIVNGFENKPVWRLSSIGQTQNFVLHLGHHGVKQAKIIL